MSSRTALITGASRGIGKAIALTLAKQGYHLVLTARNESQLHQTAAECEALGARVTPCVADINHRERMAQVVNTAIEVYGELNVLIHNAAYNETKTLLNSDPDKIDSMMDTNLRSVIHLTRAALPHIVASKERGAIIFISASLAFTDGLPGIAPLYASKMGIKGFATSLNDEIRQEGTKVACIYPGMVNSDLSAEIIERLPNFFDSAPEEMMQPEDIAEAVSYVLNSATTCCPNEILLEPLRQPCTDVRNVVQDPGDMETRIPISRPNRKVALVTGASQGMGYWIALDLAKQGYDLALVARSEGLLNDVATECQEKYGVTAIALPTDLMNPEALDDAVDECVRQLGNLSVAVACAGINRRKTAFRSTMDVWNKVIDTNLRAAMQTAQATLPYLYHNKGTLVFVSSSAVQFLSGMPGLSPYFAAKHGLSGFVACAYEDVRNHGVKMSYVSPGLTRTGLGLRPGPAAYSPTEETMIQGQDVADAVSYVINTSPTACPVRLILHNQDHMMASKRKLAEDLIAREENQDR